MKPLGHKSYGSIGHLPGSRLGPSDSMIMGGQAKIATEKVRDKYDRVIVQEKLDGSNVSVANVAGDIVALSRAGHTCVSSTYEQHHMFDWWVNQHIDRFDFLLPGERICGEWLAMAHGTVYYLQDKEPFVAFDIMKNGHERLCYDEFVGKVQERFEIPSILATVPTTIELADKLLGEYGHYGAISPAEGCVWRIERKNKVDFLGKYVRPFKVDGSYFPKNPGEKHVWNWTAWPPKT